MECYLLSEPKIRVYTRLEGIESVSLLVYGCKRVRIGYQNKDWLIRQALVVEIVSVIVPW